MLMTNHSSLDVKRNLRIAPARSFNHPPNLTLRLQPLLAKEHHINQHIVLSQLFPQLDQFALGRVDRRGGKHDDALPGVLVFAVLERQLGDLDGGDEVRGAPYLGAGVGGEEAADVVRGGYEEGWAVLLVWDLCCGLHLR